MVEGGGEPQGGVGSSRISCMHHHTQWIMRQIEAWSKRWGLVERCANDCAAPLSHGCRGACAASSNDQHYARAGATSHHQSNGQGRCSICLGICMESVILFPSPFSYFESNEDGMQNSCAEAFASTKQQRTLGGGQRPTCTRTPFVPRARCRGQGGGGAFAWWKVVAEQS